MFRVRTPRDREVPIQPRRRTWGIGWLDLYTKSPTGLPHSGLPFPLYQRADFHVVTQQALHKCTWSVKPLQEQACKPGCWSRPCGGGLGFRAVSTWGLKPEASADPLPAWPGLTWWPPPPVARVWADHFRPPFLLQSRHALLTHAQLASSFPD